jgi:hypothetical protein
MAELGLHSLHRSQRYTLGTHPTGGQGTAVGTSGHDGLRDTAGSTAGNGPELAALWEEGRSSSLPTQRPPGLPPCLPVITRNILITRMPCDKTIVWLQCCGFASKLLGRTFPSLA